ncbi:MAG TPA: amidohydrolase family protein [Bacteroidota bacterium]|nr:amidohydrolase family protein [Bacteroidota bacterium]
MKNNRAMEKELVMIQVLNRGRGRNGERGIGSVGAAGRWRVVVLISALVIGTTLQASEPIPAPKQKKPIALVGGTVHSVSGGVLHNAMVVFDKGKITAVGTNVAIPADAERINVSGKHVYPGFIDAFSNMGLTEIGSVRGTLDVSETGSVNPNARAEVAFHPESELIPVARSGGVTIAVSSPTGGIISGTSAAMMLDGWTWEDATLKAPIGLIVNWPSMVFVPNPFTRQTKEDWLKQRDQALKSLRDAFADARAYMKAKKAEEQRGVPYHDIDMRWEAMIPVLEGKVPVFVAANEVSQIQAAIAWAEQEGVKLVIGGGRDSWRVADQLKAKNIPVVLVDIHNAPQRRWEDYDLVFTLAKRLNDAGVKFCISGDYDASNSRNINHHAATAAAFGLSKEDALRSITLSSAEILGIADKVGSIDVGKDATVIVTDGDALELTSKVEQVFIQGKKIDLRDRHKQLYNKYVEKYNQLNEK